MIERWNGVEGTLVVNLVIDEDDELLDAEECSAPEFLRELLVPDNDGDRAADLCIIFESSGYYDPGSMYGGPDNLGHPPEGEDERNVTEATISNETGEHTLNQEQLAVLESHYQHDIDAVDLDD